MSGTFDCISPVDNSVYVTRSYASESDISLCLENAKVAQLAWRALSIAERAKFCSAAVDAVVEHQKEIAEEITWQMGRPIRYAAGEVGGFEERARYMIDIAETKLADIQPEEQQGFVRFIKREPLGTVFSITPWNYPYLTAVNSVIPALMAGNVVVLKTSAQTPLVSERFDAAFKEAGLPEGVFQYLHLSHEDTTKVVQSGKVNYVSFTGSTRGGAAIEKAAAGYFLELGLELGGKDPAYVRADADMAHAVANLVDGAYFNSGQSCCGIERIYVHQEIYDAFVEQFVDLVKQYKLDDPFHPDTTLGPMVSAKAAGDVRHLLNNTVHVGGKAWIDKTQFCKDDGESAYLAPQVLTNVEHDMKFMCDESFGPVVGIMPVSSDEQAIKLMNDSAYGLTASVWTQDIDSAISIGNQINTGTIFMNRCDYLDPALAWNGVKQSGKGCSLSEVAYERLTRPKSFHLRESL